MFPTKYKSFSNFGSGSPTTFIITRSFIIVIILIMILILSILISSVEHDSDLTVCSSKTNILRRTSWRFCEAGTEAGRSRRRLEIGFALPHECQLLGFYIQKTFIVFILISRKLLRVVSLVLGTSVGSFSGL